jgi:hypothetical protein
MQRELNRAGLKAICHAGSIKQGCLIKILWHHTSYVFLRAAGQTGVLVARGTNIILRKRQTQGLLDLI